MIRHCLIAIISVLLLAGCASQAEQASSSPYTLNDLYYHLQTITDLEARAILMPDVAEMQRAYYLDAAATITGEQLTEAEVADYLFSGEAQSWLRFLNFVNLIWVFASLIIVLSSVWIFARYIFPLLKRIPIIVYEILLYLLCAGFIFGAASAAVGVQQFVALPGVLGLFFLLPFTYGRYFVRPREKQFAITEAQDAETEAQQAVQQAANETHNQDGLRRIRHEFMVLTLILVVIWGAIAIAYQSVLIGYLTVFALMGAIALTPFVPHLVELMGFEKYDIGASLLLISFVLVMIFLVTHVLDIQGDYAVVFEPGIFWIGAEVYFTTLAVVSVRRYHRDKPARFLRWQIISILSGVGALFIGAYWNIANIQEIGGTYLLIYVLEKYIEMQNWRKRWAWALLGLGVLLYSFALVMNTYPQYFLLR